VTLVTSHANRIQRRGTVAGSSVQILQHAWMVLGELDLLSGFSIMTKAFGLKQVVSQLPFARPLSTCVWVSSVFFGRVSYLVSCLWHMPGRTTRKCKETLSQVKERLTREQATRTRNRIKDLLNLREIGSDSDSEEERHSSTIEIADSLSELRRVLYLVLLCLFTLILLLTYWIHNIGLRSGN
jgi:hypothetical protein